MISRSKTIAASLALVLAAIAGLYASGWLVLALLHVQAPLGPTTYGRYLAAIARPEVQPYVGRIRLAGAMGFGLPLLAWAGLLYCMLRPRKRSTHGDARFAGRADLARLGLLAPDPTGIIVGRLGTRFLRLPGTRHALLAAPTRSGKGVGP